MGLGFPFNGSICWKQEASYNAGGTGTSYGVSDSVINARIDYGETFKTIHGIASIEASFLSTPSDPTLHIEWVPIQQATFSIVSHCVKRSATSDLNSLVFDIGANIFGATKSYYYLTGCKCKTFSMRASTKNEWVCTADFSVCSVIKKTASTLTTPANTYLTLAVFNKAGNVVKKNTTSSIATIVDGVDFTIEHNLQDYWNHNSPWKQAAIPGSIDITGTCDISLDDGGGAFLGNLLIGMTDITVNNGLTNFNKFTFGSVRWDGFTFDITQSNEMLKTGVKWRAKNVTLGSGA